MNGFEVFPKGHMDRIKEAVRDTLRGDEILSGWTEGRIYIAHYSRVEKIRDVLPLALPAILITGISEEWTPSVGPKQPVPVPVGITLVWEQAEDVDVEDSGYSHSSAVNHVQTVLCTNNHLQIPKHTGPRLVDRREGFEVTSLEYEADAEYDAGELVGLSSTIVHLDMVARFRAELDYTTWTLITG